MNEQERQVISDVFRRLEQVASQPRDPEAERFIQDKVRQQPYAPYAMAQAVVVQEQALTNLNQQVQALQAEVEQLRSQPQSSGGGGFLSSIFGGGSRPEPQHDPRYQRQPQGGPWGGRPQQGHEQYGHPGQHPGMMGGQPGGQFGGGGMMPQRQGSGFLGTAMATAAGVAGGMMLGGALSNAFSGAGEAATGGLAALGGAGEAATAAAGGDFSSLSPFQDSGAQQQDASYDANEDFGGDAGGDDWA